MLHNQSYNIRLTAFSCICAVMLLALGISNQTNEQEKEELEEDKRVMKDDLKTLESQVGSLLDASFILNQQLEKQGKEHEELSEAHDELVKTKEDLEEKTQELETVIEEKESVIEKVKQQKEILEAGSANLQKNDGLKHLSSTTSKKDNNQNKTSTTKIMEVTAYTAGCEGCSGITYNGTNVKNTIYHPSGKRVVAVDPNVIPLGTIIKVDGIQYIADDIGSAIKGNKLDLLVDTKSEAINFGRQHKEVEIVEFK